MFACEQLEINTSNIQGDIIVSDDIRKLINLCESQLNEFGYDDAEDYAGIAQDLADDDYNDELVKADMDEHCTSVEDLLIPPGEFTPDITTGADERTSLVATYEALSDGYYVSNELYAKLEELSYRIYDKLDQLSDNDALTMGALVDAISMLHAKIAKHAHTLDEYAREEWPRISAQQAEAESDAADLDHMRRFPG